MLLGIYAGKLVFTWRHGSTWLGSTSIYTIGSLRGELYFFSTSLSGNPKWPPYPHLTTLHFLFAKGDQQQTLEGDIVRYVVGLK